jgi:hypothetical protein
MLIKVLLSEARAAALPGEVEMISLADVTFVMDYRGRNSPHGLFRLLSESEADRVSTWVAADPANRESIPMPLEVDSMEWLRTPSTRRPPAPVRPAPRQPLVFTPRVLPSPFVPSLADQKRGKVSNVDSKTDDLIAAGFAVDGKAFSASDAAQLKWLGMYTSRSDLSYPVTVPTKDDTQFASLVDATDVVTYYTALLARIQTVLTGGVTLKALISAAADQAELDAIVDNRT